MKSSPDFQTGSMLLLTATLICIGLAITVIAPIIDSPLARSPIAQTQPADAQADTSAARQQSLAEFYPPITRAHHELARSQSSSGPVVRNVSNQWSQPPTLPADSTISSPLPMPNGPGLTTFSRPEPSQSQTSQSFVNSPQTTVRNEVAVSNPGRTQLPHGLPAGSVYAPITINQPPAAVAPQASNNDFVHLAERIERIVTERERLAAALETERNRQSVLAQIEQMKRESEFDQQQWAKMKQQVKSFEELMAKQQSETAAQLSKLAEQNSQIDVASQAINAYRQALELAKTDAARSAAQIQSNRTAELNADMRKSFETNGNQDDAGRVRIPELPPMPTHQHRQPAPNPTIEQKPQTAEAPLKRLRVSSPVRTFQAVEPELKPQFLPLPNANKVPKPTPPPEPTDVKSQTTATEQKAELKFIPLEAPTIREFQSNLTPSWKDIPAVKSQPVPLKVSRQTVLQTTPELDVAFEHTYDFNSTTVDATAREMETSISEVASLNRSFETRSVRTESESTWQFEAIEFPDLSIQPQPLPRLKQAPSTLKKPVDSKLAAVKPLVASPAMPQRREAKSVGVEFADRTKSQAIVNSKSEETSWLKKFSGPFSRTSGVTQTSHTSSAEPNTGGRGQNRHVQRQPAEQGGLKLQIPSRNRQPSDAQNLTTEKPNMLQRIGQSFKSLGKRDNK